MVGALTREQIGTIQKRLCMPAAEADGRWGGKTQAALRADRERRVKTTPAGPGLDEPLTAAEAKALLALSEADAAQRCKR